MRHEHLPRHSARLVNEVVDVGPSLGGLHASLASPVPGLIEWRGLPLRHPFPFSFSHLPKRVGKG
jgi:hypothetical protein